MSLPELPDHLKWVITTPDGGTVRVALHAKVTLPLDEGLLQYDEFPAWDYSNAGNENAFVERVEQQANYVLGAYNRRIMRAQWIQKHFS